MFLVSYCNKLILVQRQILCQLNFKTIDLINIYFSHDQSFLDANGMERLIISQIYFYYIEALFYNRRMNIYGVYVINK